MADKTMPPTDPMPTPDSGAGLADPSKMAQDPSAPTDGGSVMMTIPKAAFDQLHQMIVQLAQGVDQLAQQVNQQANGAGSPPSEMPPAAVGGGSQSEGVVDDMDFLKGMAQEGSSR